MSNNNKNFKNIIKYIFIFIFIFLFFLSTIGFNFPNILKNKILFFLNSKILSEINLEISLKKIIFKFPNELKLLNL